MYVNNHITHTRPSLAAMLLMRAQQNNKKREREREWAHEKEMRSGKAWQIQFEAPTLTRLPPADKMLPCHALLDNGKFVYFLCCCCCCCVSCHSPFVLLCAATAPVTAPATAALAYPSFVAAVAVAAAASHCCIYIIIVHINIVKSACRGVSTKLANHSFVCECHHCAALLLPLLRCAAGHM